MILKDWLCLMVGISLCWSWYHSGCFNLFLDPSLKCMNGTYESIPIPSVSNSWSSCYIIAIEYQEEFSIASDLIRSQQLLMLGGLPTREYSPTKIDSIEYPLKKRMVPKPQNDRFEVTRETRYPEIWTSPHAGSAPTQVTSHIFIIWNSAMVGHNVVSWQSQKLWSHMFCLREWKGINLWAS